jgi:hypothetical protein
MFCQKCGVQIEDDFQYCPKCGIKLDTTLPSYRVLLSNENITEKEAIEGYFYSGFNYDVILNFLSKYHGISMSMSTLKRRLSNYNLKRNKRDLNLSDIEGMIRHELDGPSCVSGYRGMWHTLRVKYGVHVPRKEVECLLRQLDPDGVEERKRHKLKRRSYKSPGPNYCWHIDGYDKLKPFGFPIHGAIDGYSRRIMWLNVDRTNNNPAVTATFFVDCIEEVGGCPVLLRTDCGTENVVIAGIQCFLRDDNDDDFAGEKSHRYGSSTTNQRIEAWWSYFRRTRMAWWINFFKDLTDRGTLISGSALHEEALWFCFSELIQQELDFTMIHWNTHYIRQSRHDTVPGKPEELYFLPENSNATDQLQSVSQDKVEEARLRCVTSDANNDYQDYFEHLLSLIDLSKPNNWKEALDLYCHLVSAAV